MMGRQVNDLKQLFYAFDLQTVFPDGHLPRGLSGANDKLLLLARA